MTLKYITRQGIRIQEREGRPIETGNTTNQPKLEPSKKPLLRSLADVKRCKSLGPMIGRKPTCGSCAKHLCFKKGETQLTYCAQDCHKWEDKATPAKMSITSRQTIHIDQKTLAPEMGGLRLNPSIIEHEGGYVFAWRQSWGGAKTCMVRMNKNFKQFGHAVQVNAYHPDAVTCQEDARLFRHKNQLHIWYTGYRRDKKKGIRIANTLVAKLNNQTFKPEYIFHPRIPNRNLWEKNTAYFDCLNELYCVYSIVPHRVLKVNCENIVQAWETPTRTSWQYGHLRGGASPVLHRGHYYHFFHGMRERGKGGGRLYSVGVAVFEPRPPFRIVRITHEPIDIADPRTNPKPGVDVLFPCGAIFVDGHWAVSMGVHDKWSEIRFYSEAMIEAALDVV